MKAAGVCLVIVQVGIGRKIRADPNHYILKHHRPVRKGPQPDHLLVPDPKASRRIRGQMDMPLGGDDYCGGGSIFLHTGEIKNV